MVVLKKVIAKGKIGGNLTEAKCDASAELDRHVNSTVIALLLTDFRIEAGYWDADVGRDHN